jgi:mannose-6-phosphate isomerase-like protein (cupin superfamily)
MPQLPGGCWVFGPEDGRAVVRDTWLSRQLASRDCGARYIAQTVNEYRPGRSPLLTRAAAEEVHYVVRGACWCRIGDFRYRLLPGTGALVPPGAAFGVENPGPANLLTVSVCCPEEPAAVIDDGPWPAPADAPNHAPVCTVREEEREPTPVGNRKFKLLVDTGFGCRQVTQFVGFIPPSRAPFHYHPYEEAIYILEGSGIVHVDGGSCAFSPGSCIFLPIGLPHCLENPGAGWVRLLGVFYPSGSPAAAYER